MTDEFERWTAFHFSQSNPARKRSGRFSALLRRVADTIDALGEVEVLDITFKATPTESEEDLTMTVYYTHHR